MNETELVEAARKGDQEAFQKLVESHKSQVGATIIGMLGRGPEAEDIGQETFIRFYKALPRFRGDSKVGTYLTRIAVNLCINEIRRRQRRRRFYFSDGETRIKNAQDKKAANNPGEARNMVQQGLKQLAPKFRSVLVLRLIDGYSTRETAEILKLPTGTVLSRLARAQEKLKNILDREDDHANK
jgi:RNA polymerase sigma-70 factor, ECF subfamily